MHTVNTNTSATVSSWNSCEPPSISKTLGQLAAQDIRNVAIFKKYGLDFCCGGKKTVKEACDQKGLDASIVEQELNMAGKQPFQRPLPYNDWNLDFLADYIVNTHHYYVRNTLPDLLFFARKVMKVHGGEHPELVAIHKIVEEVNLEMTSHMMKEEKVLFPYIHRLVSFKINHQAIEVGQFGSIVNPVSMMESEHEDVGGKMENIRNLTNNYTLPQGACGSYNALYRILEEFEEDLHLHVHLENNILFPKAIQLEKEIFSAK